MEETKTRKPNVQPYFYDEDYDEVLEKLPNIIKEANKKAGEELEPTIHEKKQVMDVIKEFIRIKGRKVYGGTAINEAIKAKNPDDAIYDDYTFSDIEFYSPTPVVDLVELTNLLYKRGYKYVVGSEAQHEETYSIYVNFQLYCDISYATTRIYHGIKTIVIDGIHYADPHFILIDQLRIINQPLTSAEQRWEKTFKRMFKLLKYYPLEDHHKKIDLPEVPSEYRSYMHKIKNDFMSIKEIQDSCLISGFEAYNFYIRHALQDKHVDQPARISSKMNPVGYYVVNVPYLELVSVNYRDTVNKLYNFVREIVVDPKKVTMEEYFPLFQFTGYSVFILYDGNPIVRVFEADGFCVPNVKTTRGYMYVSYQYTLMSMLISKFRAHLDKNKQMYFNYAIAISNLVKVKNDFLHRNKLGVINDTIFSEFRIACTGTTVSFIRASKLRGLERYKQCKLKGLEKHKQGKYTPFRYSPEIFLAQDEESRAKFNPSKYTFKNTSGNKIMNPKNLIFKLDENGNINTDIKTEPALSDDPSELERIKPKTEPESSDDNSSKPELDELISSLEIDEFISLQME